MATKIGKDVKVVLTTKSQKGKINVPVSVQGLQGDPGVWVGHETPDDSYVVWIDPDGEGHEGLVSSVNGETGDVVLDADDVGAIDSADILTNGDILAIWNSF